MEGFSHRSRSILSRPTGLTCSWLELWWMPKSLACVALGLLFPSLLDPRMGIG